MDARDWKRHFDHFKSPRGIAQLAEDARQQLVASVRATRSRDEPWVPLKAMRRAWQEYNYLRAAAVTLWGAKDLPKLPPVRRAGRRVRSLASLLRPFDDLARWGLTTAPGNRPQLWLHVRRKSATVVSGQVRLDSATVVLTERQTRLLERLIQYQPAPLSLGHPQQHCFGTPFEVRIGNPYRVRNKLIKKVPPLGDGITAAPGHGAGHVLLIHAPPITYESPELRGEHGASEVDAERRDPGYRRADKLPLGGTGS